MSGKRKVESEVYTHTCSPCQSCPSPCLCVQTIQFLACDGACSVSYEVAYSQTLTPSPSSVTTSLSVSKNKISNNNSTLGNTSSFFKQVGYKYFSQHLVGHTRYTLQTSATPELTVYPEITRF